MAAASVTAEGIPVPRSGTSKPKRLIVGRRRKVLVKAIAALQALKHQDEREKRKAATRRYTPYPALGNDGDRTDRAFNALMIVLLAAKSARA